MVVTTWGGSAEAPQQVRPHHGLGSHRLPPHSRSLARPGAAAGHGEDRRLSGDTVGRAGSPRPQRQRGAPSQPPGPPVASPPSQHGDFLCGGLSGLLQAPRREEKPQPVVLGYPG